MCAIVDANVRDEVFGEAASPAGKFFLDWLTTGRGKLVVGGKLREELADNQNFKLWLSQAVQAGRARILDDGKVDSVTSDVLAESVCQSNDPHVIALARVSGVRLLYTNDGQLQQDFKTIIQEGVIYTTRLNKETVTRTHKSLLGTRRRICDC